MSAHGDASVPSPASLAGGCQCGALRYAVERPWIDAGYCHCRICQRAHGAPVVAWLTAAQVAFRYVQGTPAVHASSKDGRREFCARCGSQLVFRSENDATRIDIAVATLDVPAEVVPEYHIWRESRLPWFDTQDTLPRHADAGPDWT